LLAAARRCTFFTCRAAARPPTPTCFRGGWRWRRPPYFLQKGGAMTEVRLRDEDSLERALKLFKRKLQKSGLFGELRRRRHYVKPSEARAIKTAAAQRRKRKKKVTKSEW
jgi:small subunit ribosomal protein S21